MPDGFTVKIPVIQQQVTQIYVAALDEEIPYAYNIVKGTNKGISLMGNITHAVDSWVCREMIRKCPFDMLSIHDEYMCHPNNASYMHMVYRDIMAELSQMDLFESIVYQITGETVEIDPNPALKELIQNGLYGIH